MYIYVKNSTVFTLVGLFLVHFFAFSKKEVTISFSEQLLPYNSPAVEGYLDRLSFAAPQAGGNGTGTTFIPFSIAGSSKATTNDFAYAVAVQADGCIVIAGTTQAPNTNVYFAVARFLPNGELDPTFGGGSTGAPLGTQYIPFNIAGGALDQATALAIQPDGKIVVAGTSNSFFAVARFLSNGQLDTSFNEVGAPAIHQGTQCLNFRISGGGVDLATGVALQSDGKIVVAGTSNSFFAIARFLPNGQLDASFNEVATPATHQGTRYINFHIAAGAADIASALAIQSDGKIVLVGTSRKAGGGVENRFALARFLTTGQLDTSFNQAATPGTHPGTQYIDFNIAGGGSGVNNATSVVLQPDSQIVLAGLVNNRVGIARFDTTGQLDLSFGQKGTTLAGTQYVPFSIVGAGIEQVSCVGLQSDGKILVGGASQYAGQYYSLVRFSATGILDTSTFGNVGTSKAGTTYISFSISGQTPYDYAAGMAFQPDGKVVLGGYSSNGGGAPFYFSLASFFING